MATIILESVSKRYEAATIFSDLNLQVEHGECFTLLGPSGCGKTVLLRLIAGFETPDTGTIRIGDTVVASAGEESVPPDRRDLGVVFQDYAVWPHMTVLQNVGYPLKLAKIPEKEYIEQAMRAIGLVNMVGLEKRLPSELSGGQQQRVALARALVANPSIMLLDEPLSNLDANLREEMRFEIKELQRRLGITVLYVTHDQEIALAISDRIAIMDETGRLRQLGAPVDIYESPVDFFVFNFMGVANALRTNRRGDAVCVGEGAQVLHGPPQPAGVASLVAGCRPSDVILRRPDGTADAPEGVLRGKIRRASFLGAVMDYLIEIDGAYLRTEVETQEAIARNLMFQDGDPCDIGFHALHWFDGADVPEGHRPV
ncbi:MAG: ABC transporter ATP-binding protein [Desulfovibrio sp.]|jgi:iron(III) transport system ATP-binding protein|nr:ABC transporter ATP-binding protein [Desulfovibrio sp.]